MPAIRDLIRAGIGVPVGVLAVLAMVVVPLPPIMLDVLFTFNIALSLVEHAYFMEKGAIRFDGAATALLERPDLVRSVFLEGATAANQPVVER